VTSAFLNPVILIRRMGRGESFCSGSPGGVERGYFPRRKRVPILRLGPSDPQPGVWARGFYASRSV